MEWNRCGRVGRITGAGVRDLPDAPATDNARGSRATEISAIRKRRRPRRFRSFRAIYSPTMQSYEREKSTETKDRRRNSAQKPPTPILRVDCRDKISESCIGDQQR